MATKLMTLPIKSIREPGPGALRGVNKNTEKYLGLVDSIKLHGVQQTISVREQTDAQTKETFWQVIDGLQRWTAAGDAGLDELDCKIMDATDIEVLELQMVGNLHKLDTLPAQFAKQILRIAALHPTITPKQLAARVGMSVKWVEDRMTLVKLKEQYQKLVDEEKMPLLNAYSLAKLAPEDQDQFVDRAQQLPPDQFVGQVNARVKEIKDAAKAGRDANPEQFVAVPHLRTVKELSAELETLAIGQQIGVKDLASYKAGLEVALKLDPIFVEKSKADWTAAQEKAKADKARKDAEKLQKTVKAAQEAQAKAVGTLEKLGVADPEKVIKETVIPVEAPKTPELVTA